MAGVEEIYIGSILVSDVSVSDGYFRAQPVATVAAGDIFGGVSLERVSVLTGEAAGARVVTVAKDGVVGFAVGSLAITDIGAAAYSVDDDGGITVTSTNNQWVGYIVDVDATYVWVDITKAFMMTSTAT
ncbi:MAG: hypothetical protein ACRD1K_20755 [Acidimicrobiales bacterium]